MDWYRGVIVLLLLVAAGVGLVACSSDNEPVDATSRCESWAEKVEAGDIELTREQEAAIRGTLAIRDQGAADALGFEAPEVCRTAAVFQLVGADGSLTPMALYLAGECRVDWEHKSVCRQLEDVGLWIDELSQREQETETQDRS